MPSNATYCLVVLSGIEDFEYLGIYYAEVVRMPCGRKRKLKKIKKHKLKKRRKRDRHKKKLR
ncbi:hypothetical protein AMJ87_05130 [candidate division WOR_3 bacterium SM23_60]|uniref:Uncharacterized protein n=1 Tax=candidate division WOR_3 bacterium SM23_60 TaxID=1703780 RepID=A0A0S8GKG5_UNCW3|nr:MAG: hypothetical protein AMJ87_05130 [candidate division WOR_3 bacterium SM23_60]